MLCEKLVALDLGKDQRRNIVHGRGRFCEA
jgi:hypothetical protein